MASMALGDTLAGYTFGINLGKFQVETVQKVSDLSFGQEVVEFKQVTQTGRLAVTKQPGQPQSGEVTITRGMDKSKQFTGWIQKSLEGQGDARENIAITMMDPQRKPVRRVILARAWASRW